LLLLAEVVAAALMAVAAVQAGSELQLVFPLPRGLL